MATHRLSTRLQIACRRAAALKAEAHAAAWQNRLDPAAYTCTRTGEPGARVWTAEGPAGQRFEFSKTDTGDVLVMSSSGGIYILTIIDGLPVCDCPSAAKNGGNCKHTVAWAGVKMAHAMARDDVRRALRAEAAAMHDEDPAAGYRDFYPGEGE